MATLSYRERKALPNSAYAVVQEVSEEKAKTLPSAHTTKIGNKWFYRRFPVQDKAHQRNALRRAAQDNTKGSSALKASVKKIARKKLYGSSKAKKMG